MSTYSRRHFIKGAAVATVASQFPALAQAGAPMLGQSTPIFNRIQFGDFEITSLLASTRVVNGPHNIFGINVSEDEFKAASAAANIPADNSNFFFTPTIVNTGSELVLFDTGTDPEGITRALAAAGYTPDQVDKVVITHMHGDHIGGIMTGDQATFANAAYFTGSAEFDDWDMSGDEGFEAKVRPLEEQFSFLDEGGSVASGITAIEAFGHTMGHMCYLLESGGKSLLIGGDFANHYVWSLAHPDWEVLFDKDKAMAVQSRKKILGMLAADKIPFIGYHMPFPGLGYVEAVNDAYRYEPHSYQLLQF